MSSWLHTRAGAPGFSDQALAFHRQADRIGVAAAEGDRTRVATELAITLQACTSCHATWKQKIVSEAEWEEMAAQNPGDAR